MKKKTKSPLPHKKRIISLITAFVLCLSVCFHSGMTVFAEEITIFGTLTFEDGAELTLDPEYELVMKPGSSLHMLSGSRLIAHGSIKGSCQSFMMDSGSELELYLSEGAKFLITPDEMQLNGTITCFGYDVNTDGNGTVAVTNAGTPVTSESSAVSSTVYTYTAVPNEVFNDAVWTKGENGDEIGRGLTLEIECFENAKYQIYAHFCHSHVYGQPTWNWNSTSSATATFVCTDSHCDDQEKGEQIVNAVITQNQTDPDCVTDGKTDTTATASFGGREYTDVKTEVLNRLGHDKMLTAAKAPTATEDGNIAYWTCQRCGKLFLDEACQQETTLPETVLPATGAYVFVPEGCTDPSTAEDPTYRYEKNSDGGLLFVIKNIIDDTQLGSRFTGAEVDGAALSSDQFDTAEGSLLLTLKAAYLQTLSEGEHTLTVHFSDGQVAHTFTVAPAPQGSDSPATGEGLWIVLSSLALLATSGLSVLLVVTRKKYE